jgi:hypothetical protein
MPFAISTILLVSAKLNAQGAKRRSLFCIILLRTLEFGTADTWSASSREKATTLRNNGRVDHHTSHRNARLTNAFASFSMQGPWAMINLSKSQESSFWSDCRARSRRMKDSLMSFRRRVPQNPGEWQVSVHQRKWGGARRPYLRFGKQRVPRCQPPDMPRCRRNQI